jgi:glycosyltransferase involved in cell wall biosynthesis
MRILFLLNDLETGGVARVTISLLRHLSPALQAKNGAADLLVAGPHRAMTETLPGSVQLHGVFDNPGRLRHRLTQVRRDIQALSKGYDVLVPISPHMTALSLGLGVPTVPWVHFQYKTMMKHRPEGVLTNTLIRCLYPWKKHIVFAGPGARLEMPALKNRKHWQFIPNLFDLEAYSGLSTTAEKVKLLKTQGLPVFGFVGRLSKEKGIYRLLAAHHHLLAAGLKHHLVVIGDGPERHLLKNAGPNLHDLGADPNPLKAMAMFDVTLLTSYMDTWPTVAIESLAMRTPVVAYDCPSGPRLILTGDLAPGLAKNGDVEDFKRAVEWALTEAPDALTRQPQVVTDSAPAAVVRQWLDLFSKVLSV